MTTRTVTPALPPIFPVNVFIYRQHIFSLKTVNFRSGILEGLELCFSNLYFQSFSPSRLTNPASPCRTCNEREDDKATPRRHCDSYMFVDDVWWWSVCIIVFVCACRCMHKRCHASCSQQFKPRQSEDWNGRWYARRLARRKWVRCVDEKRLRKIEKIGLLDRLIFNINIFIFIWIRTTELA